MSIAITLKLHRKEKGWSQVDLARKSGVKRDLIAQVETGKSGFGAENQKLIADALGIDFTLLNYVKENEPKDSYHEGDDDKSAGERIQLYLSQLPEKDADMYVPYYNVEITAGRIEQIFEDADEVPEGYIYAPHYPGCVACHVKGDSMYDRIFPGSRLFVYYMKNKKYIDYGQIYLIVLDGYRLLKYIHPHPTDETKVLLSSYNKHYSDWPVERADILHLFLVKGYENQNAN